MFELEQKFKKHSASLYASIFSKVHNLLFTGGADRVVASWDLDEKENTALSIKTDSAILNLNLLNNEKHLFIGLFNGNFHIINLEDKKEERFFPYHKSGVFGSCYVAEQSLLVVGAGDGTISIWNTDNFELLKNYKLAEGKIRAITQIGEAVFIGTSEGQILRIRFEDLGKAEVVYQHSSAIYCLAAYDDKKVLLFGDKDAHLTGITNLEEAVLKQVISIPAHNWPIYAIKTLLNGTIATCSRDKIVKIWDAKSLEVNQRLCFPEFKGHLNSINNLAYDVTNDRLISVGDDKQICVWKRR